MLHLLYTKSYGTTLAKATKYKYYEQGLEVLTCKVHCSLKYLWGDTWNVNNMFIYGEWNFKELEISKTLENDGDEKLVLTKYLTVFLRAPIYISLQ